MNRYIEKLKTFLAEQPLHCEYTDANSILEMLYCYYSEENPIDSAVIRCRFRELDSILCRLPLSDNDAIFSLTCKLCSAYEQRAFLEGIQVGMRLFEELGN